MRPRNISPDQAEKYYYEKDPVIKKNNEWQGKGAESLGLSGAINKIDFKSLIFGCDLEGNQIIQDGVNGEHRAGIDIPLSPPKSVSILALHCGVDSFLEAHHQAVKETIDYIESKYVYARLTENHETKALLTAKGIFAKFTHSTSRENDPQLHTHVILVNNTETHRGPRATYNDEIFQDQRLVTSVYQNRLASKIRELGYRIANTGTEKWEVLGVQDEWIKIFSKRSKNIDKVEQELKENGFISKANDAQLRNIAVLESRPEKDKKITKEELLESWEKQVPRYEILKSVKQYLKDHSQDIETTPTDIIAKSARALHESESTFMYKDIINTALQLGRGYFNEIEIDDLFQKELASGVIQNLKTYQTAMGVKKNIYSTQEMLKTEMAIVQDFNKGRSDQFQYSLPSDAQEIIERDFEDLTLTADQKVVVKDILTSPQQFMIVQGDAGSGKTTALKVVKEIMDEVHPDRKIYGLGFTGKAAYELTKKSGIESATVDSFLQKKAFEGDLVIVDEASMIGSYQFKAVMDIALKKGFKTVFVGDGKQLQAISAGRMFKDLQKQGHVLQVRLEDSIRQKTGYMRSVVQSLKEYSDSINNQGIDQAISILQTTDRVYSIPDEEERLAAVIDCYMQSPHDSCVVTPVNKERVVINQEIRKRLQDGGTLSADEKTLDISVPVALVGVNKFFAGNYKIGHKVFVLEANAQDIKPGSIFEICGQNITANTITVRPLKGEDTRIMQVEEIADKLSIYKDEQREFVAGDKIVFLKNDKKMNVQNGVTGIIEKLDEQGNMIVEVDERKVRFNVKHYNYFDHGYCVTIHKSQGQDTTRVLYSTDSDQKKLNTTESIYVALTRASDDAFIFCDDINKLSAQWKEKQIKTSTVDHLKLI